MSVIGSDSLSLTDAPEEVNVAEHPRLCAFPPCEALLTLYRQRGPVINVRRRDTVILLGAAANEFVFTNSDAFSWREAFEELIPVDGPTALIVSDGDDHRRRRGFALPALQHRRVGDYVQTMAVNTDAVIDAWLPGTRVDIFQQFRSVIRRNTAECLFGPRIAVHADYLGEQLQPLIDLTNLNPSRRRLHRWLGSPFARRAKASRERIDELVDAVIADSRLRPRADDRMLTTLISGRADRCESLSDNEIRDMIVSLIADGYEVTSGALAWAIYALLTVPGAWDAAAAEVRRVLNGRPPTPATLRDLTYLNGVVHETVRLCTTNSARKVKRDLRFEGHPIRAGQRLIFSAYVTHRLPELWPEPWEFRPERWDSAAPDYRKPTPYEFIPFGRGLHRCIGSSIAITQMMVMLARLVGRTTLRLPPQHIRAHNIAALRPWPGLTVEIAERASPAAR
ncbi:MULTISPECIES: cytochrome P450 [Mycobacterium]|uniref:cytochrome P450 n=1 Tax=Mycobacterium TaxID=1763 RepID=UPI0009E976B4|nr:MULTISPECIES: cytochrome P450 [Mycobacterium]MDP7728964.1 cytochrome P450 [Mycobacterium sp. TY813]